MKKIVLALSIFFLFVGVVLAKEKVKFAACVDGDTIKVYINNKKETVRLLAIDTPESVKEDTAPEYYGKEASEYTCKKIKSAKKIELEYDEKSDKVDKYDRLLAWVFIDGELLQSELVEYGYAEVAYLYNNYKYVDILKKKQEKASANGLGIWNASAKADYEKNDNQEVIYSTDNYENIEIIILTVLFLIFALISKLFFKKNRHK